MSCKTMAVRSTQIFTSDQSSKVGNVLLRQGIPYGVTRPMSLFTLPVGRFTGRNGSSVIFRTSIITDLRFSLSSLYCFERIIATTQNSILTLPYE